MTGRPLRLALVAPPWYHVPPRDYGGIELLCAGLLRELICRGHDVSLIAAGGAPSLARLHATFEHPQAHRLGEALPELLHAALAAKTLNGLCTAGQVDVVHDHSLGGMLTAGGRSVPTVATAHLPATGDWAALYQAVSDHLGLVAASDTQRSRIPHLPWLGTVHHGVDMDHYDYRCRKEGFVLFLGRFHPDKSPHFAVEAARRAGLPITLAGKCSEPVEQAYFHRELEPLLGQDVTVLGPVGVRRKAHLLATACCLLFTSVVEEAFGLVMIEALASGTPVAALRHGAVVEVVHEGVTGAWCDDPADLPDAIDRALRVDPSSCRNHIRQNFTVQLMTERYLSIYRQVLDGA